MSETKRTPDTFQLARQIYNARTRHFDKAYALLERAGYRVMRAPLPGKRQLAVVLPPDLSPVDPAENDALWGAISTQLERLTVTIRSTQRLPFVSGAGDEGRGKVRQ
jgi:hypothetical protein